MIPTWLNEVVGDFGRQMGLNNFALNDRGTAGVRFENGATLRLEATDETLAMIVGVQPSNAVDAAAFTKKLLTAAHYENAGGAGVRAAILKRTGEAVFVRRLEVRSVDLPKLQETFELLWETACEIGGAA